MAYATAATSLDQVMGSLPRDSAGNPVMLFGAVSISLAGPTIFGTHTQVPIPKPFGVTIEEMPEDDDEICFVVTQKGRESDMFSASTKPKRSRKHAPKRGAAPFDPRRSMMVQPRAIKKRALQAYQEELVAYPALPTSNAFAPLRVVEKNSSTARTCPTEEMPRSISFPRQPRKTFSDSSMVENPALTIHRVYKAIRDAKQRRNKHYFHLAQNTSKQVWIPKEQGNIPQAQSVSIKSRLTYAVQDSRASYNGPSQPEIPQRMKVTLPSQAKARGRKNIMHKHAHTSLNHQPNERVSVFSRLGARQSPSPQRTGGMTIVAPNPDSKKRRVVQQQTNSDEEYAVYAISAIDEETSSQEDDLDPLNPTVYVIEDGGGGRR